MFGIESLKEQVLELTNWIIVLRREVNEIRCQVNVCKYTPERCLEEAQAQSCLTKADFYFKIHEITEKLTELYEFVHSKEKFVDYMKNVDKLNVMVNEIKEVSDMARANLSDKKHVTEEYFDDKIGDICIRFNNISVDQAVHNRKLYEKMTEIETQVKRLAKPRAPRKKVVKKKEISTASKKKFTPAEV